MSITVAILIVIILQSVWLLALSSRIRRLERDR
jgi:hypothetical protein